MYPSNDPFQQALIERYRQHKLPLDLPQEFLQPFYGGGSIANITPSIVYHLTQTTFGEGRLLPEIEARVFPRQYRHIALVLIDGLGYDWLFDYLQQEDSRPAEQRFWQQILAEAAVTPLTSVSPSTTAAALTSFWTGVAPAAHGVLGYEMWLKGLGVIGNMIFHSPTEFFSQSGLLYQMGFDVNDFLSSPLIGSHLTDLDVMVRSLQHSSIVNSGLSTMLDKGAQRLPYKPLSDMWFNFTEALESQPQQASFNWLYWGEHDGLAHRYGADNPRMPAQFEAFGLRLLRTVQRLKQQGPADTLVLVTADHGHLVTPKNPRYNLNQHTDVLETLAMPPSGDNRLPYIYTLPGMRDTFRQRFYQHWSEDEFAMLPAQNALQAGLFGQGIPHPHSHERIGDWLVLPKGESYLWWSDRPNPIIGRHGGLSRTEMLVPLIAIEI
jgi:hypothetical protein